MAQTRPQPKIRRSGANVADKAAPGQTVVHPTRPQPAPARSLLEEAERIMGVEPIFGRTSRLLPGY